MPSVSAQRLEEGYAMMIYRKAPPQPTRRLLRVVAASGAGALVGVAACGGETQTDHAFNGTVAIPSSGSSGGGTGSQTGSGADSGSSSTGATGSPYMGPMGVTGSTQLLGSAPYTSGSAGNSSGMVVTGVLPTPSGSTGSATGWPQGTGSYGFMGSGTCAPCGVIDASIIDAGHDGGAILEGGTHDAHDGHDASVNDGAIRLGLVPFDASGAD